MEPEKLSKLLRILPTNAAVRRSDCPDDHQLAAYVDKQLPEEPGKQIALHLSDCNYCTAQVSLLKRLHSSVPEESVSEFVLARANRMGKSKKRPTFQYVSRWASAAVVVLAVSLVFKWNLPDQDFHEATNTTSPDPGSQVIEQRLTRNLGPDILKPRIRVPSNGATVKPGVLVFSWSEVPGSLYYDVRIVTDVGDLIWQAQAEGTEVGLPDYLHLKPDTEYFFRVDAHLASAKRISSQHVLFSIGEQH